jgi:hypothetical protein
MLQRSSFAANHGKLLEKEENFFRTGVSSKGATPPNPAGLEAGAGRNKEGRE